MDFSFLADAEIWTQRRHLTRTDHHREIYIYGRLLIFIERNHDLRFSVLRYHIITKAIRKTIVLLLCPHAPHTHLTRLHFVLSPIRLLPYIARCSLGPHIRLVHECIFYDICSHYGYDRLRSVRCSCVFDCVLVNLNPFVTVSLRTPKYEG